MTAVKTLKGLAFSFRFGNAASQTVFYVFVFSLQRSPLYEFKIPFLFYHPAKQQQPCIQNHSGLKHVCLNPPEIKRLLDLPHGFEQ